MSYKLGGRSSNLKLAEFTTAPPAVVRSSSPTVPSAVLPEIVHVPGWEIFTAERAHEQSADMKKLGLGEFADFEANYGHWDSVWDSKGEFEEPIVLNTKPDIMFE